MPTSRLTTFHRRVFAAAVLAYTCTAWYSTGFQNADEHYQVIAFALWKTGSTARDHLPWEFDEQIRSTLLPWVAAALFKAGSLVGVNNPFHLSFLLRLFTALLALLTMKRFVIATAHSVGTPMRKAYIALSYFLWFLPFQLVRFSNEAWSLMALMLTLAVLYQRPAYDRWPWWAGFWATIMVCLKPSMLPAAAGIALWTLLIAKPRTAEILQAAASVLLTLVLNTAMDSLFYGAPASSFANYLHANFPSHPDHLFDTFPWWYYAPWIVKYAIPPIGLCMLGAAAILIRYHARSVLTWCILPLVIALAIVPHKELRFLFPLAGLVPLVLVLAFATANKGWKVQMRTGRLWNPAIWLFSGVNMAALSVVLFTPAGSGRTRLAEYIRTHYPLQQVRINYLANDTTVWDIRIPRFYLGANVTDTILPTPCIPLAESRGRMDLVVARGTFPSCADAPVGHGWEPLLPAQPAWKERLLRLYEWEDAKPAWVLYRPRTVRE